MSTVSREDQLATLETTEWDVAIIGGGASGLGSAFDAASRGLKTLVIEQSDFAKATSSRSTKLIHGGVRYLEQGNVSLVRESLYERGLLLKNASTLVTPLEFVIPTFSIFERLFYATGLKLYDLLAGKLGMQSSRILTSQQVRDRVQTINSQKLSGGVSYFDAQFDDARLALALAQSTIKLGGTALNYVKCVQLLKAEGRINGLIVQDVETSRTYTLHAKSVLNATGIFTDQIRHLDDPAAKKMLTVSQGTHLVVDREFLPGQTAIIIPKTADGRVVFIIPWHGKTVIGTTDIPKPVPQLEPVPTLEEIEFLLQHANQYLSRQVHLSDIRSIYCGLRPLVNDSDATKTSKISRDHVIKISSSGLVTLTGGKWTTYRRMAEDAVNTLIETSGLPKVASQTASLPLTGHSHDAPHETQSAETLTDEFIRDCVRYESARTVEDVLARRCRLLLLDARAAIETATHVANVMGAELGQTPDWIQQQILEFTAVARLSLPPELPDSE